MLKINETQGWCIQGFEPAHATRNPGFEVYMLLSLAAGIPGLIQADMVKKGATVIDIGIICIY